ncbi:hypothetical protein I4607_11360 [Proteus mirabilis]|nr:hypothetical protein [Proteus mirabilis]HEJ9539863.1 hypothetical protein [Proteus mirabilis]
MNFKNTTILDAIKNEEMKSFYPLKMGENITAESFEKLIELAEESTNIYKNEEFIPKSLLKELYLISVGITSENYRLQDDEMASVAERIMNCFNLLIDGKAVTDIVPDGPRII